MPRTAFFPLGRFTLILLVDVHLFDIVPGAVKQRIVILVGLKVGAFDLQLGLLIPQLVNHLFPQRLHATTKLYCLLVDGSELLVQRLDLRLKLSKLILMLLAHFLADVIKFDLQLV